MCLFRPLGRLVDALALDSGDDVDVPRRCRACLRVFLCDPESDRLVCDECREAGRDVDG